MRSGILISLRATVALLALLPACRVYQLRPGPGSDRTKFDQDSYECLQVLNVPVYSEERYRGCMRARGHIVEIKNRLMVG